MLKIFLDKFRYVFKDFVDSVSTAFTIILLLYPIILLLSILSGTDAMAILWLWLVSMIVVPATIHWKFLRVRYGDFWLEFPYMVLGNILAFLFVVNVFRGFHLHPNDSLFPLLIIVTPMFIALIFLMPGIEASKNKIIYKIRPICNIQLLIFSILGLFLVIVGKYVLEPYTKEPGSAITIATIVTIGALLLVYGLVTLIYNNIRRLKLVLKYFTIKNKN